MTTALPDRDGFAKLLSDLLTPALAHLTPDGAALDLPASSVADFDDEAARLEGFSRALVGAAILAAGGFAVPARDRLVAGLGRGPARWGAPRGKDQRLVSAGALSLALLIAPDLAPDHDADARAALRAWLAASLDCECGDNNRVLFRVVTRLAVERLGGPLDAAALERDLARVDGQLGRDGAFHDGPDGPRDGYLAWTIHPLTLLYAHLRGAADPVRAERWRASARAYTSTLRAATDDDGAVVPYGRSLGYRFATSFFWGAVAAWDPGVLTAPGLPAGFTWGALRELALRPIVRFLARPIRDAHGLLTAGWNHAQPRLAEPYGGPWSPYWALTAFLPLVLPAAHPFWSAPAVAPDAMPAAPDLTPLPPARATLARHRAADGRVTDVVLLASAHAAPRWLAGAGPRYAKLAYSSRFGFGLDEAEDRLAPDSTLIVHDALGRPRTRAASDRAWLVGDVVVSAWRPLAGVWVTTWLVACPPWHVRVHRVTSALPLATVEGGFLAPLPDDADPRAARAACAPDLALTDLAVSRVIDLPIGGRPRSSEVRVAPAGSSIASPRALVPVLVGRLRPLRDWLACAVMAAPRDASSDHLAPPAVTRRGDVLTVVHRGIARSVSIT